MTKLDLNSTRYLQAVVKRKLIIIYAVVVLLILSAAYTAWNAFPPLYKSTCSIKFEKESAVGGLFSRILSSPEDRDIETQQVIITSYDLLVEVAGNLSLISRTAPVNKPEVYTVVEDLRAKVGFEKEDATNIIHISVTDRDPAFAQKTANELAETYSRQQSEQQQKRLNEAVKYIEEQLKINSVKLQKSEEQFNRFSRDNQLLSIGHQSENLLLRKKDLEDEIRAENNTERIRGLKLDLLAIDGKINDLMQKKLEFNSLKKEIDTSRSMLSFLEEKKQEAMIRLAEKPDVVRIVKRAQLPSTPVNAPDIMKTCLTGLIAGLFLGLITAILTEAFSGQTGLIDEIEKRLGLKVLGVIPRTDIKNILEGMKSDQGNKPDESSGNMYINLVSHFAPKTMISESFRALRTNVLFFGENEKARTIAVTSSYPQEGKSMVAVNLAVSLAQAGLKTLLVGSDFRSPVLAKIFTIEDRPGLTDVLLGNCPWQETVKTVTDMIMGEMTMDDLMINPGLDNLNIITSGPVPPNPAELINSQRFAEFIGDVEKEYDIIILDSAPVLASADTTILGARVNALLLVNRPGSVSQKILKRTSAQLKRINCNILGVVLNDVKSALIPDALRKKYSRRDSVSAAPVKRETTAIKEKKKNRFIRILLLLAVILLIASVILWQKGIITFPDKLFTPEADVKKSESPPVKVQPAKKDILPPEKEKEEKIEAADTVETGKEESPVPVELGVKKGDKEKNRTSGELKPEYKEGSYPYSIYLGSYKTIKRAERAVDIYAEKEIDSFPVKVEFAEKGVWYRVYAGYYPDAESAGVFIEENKLKDVQIKKTAYACYIDSFTDNDSLENSMNLLKEKQYFPYIITDHVDNVHFLFAGAFLTRIGAEGLSEELREDGIENKVVLR